MLIPNYLMLMVGVENNASEFDAFYADVRRKSRIHDSQEPAIP